MRISNSSFLNNSAAGHGGGAFLDSGTLRTGTVLLENVTFAQNTAREGGGGLAAFAGLTLTGRDCTWAGNVAQGSGVEGLVREARTLRSTPRCPSLLPL